PPTLPNGSGRIVASRRNVACTAVVADRAHAILNPAFGTTPPPTLARVPIWACGNSRVDPIEQCDDGNTVGADTCTADCQTCLCGDVSGDGEAAPDDIDALRDALAGIGTGLTFPERCNVIGPPGTCDILDVVVLRRSLALPPRSPGRQPVCEACTAARPTSLCGDVNGTDEVAQNDVDELRGALAGVGPGLSFPERCNVIGPPSSCDILDVVVIRRSLATPPLAPGRQPLCEAFAGIQGASLRRGLP
ncbi:MAG: hypothetical protein ACE5FG_15270, partial [Myxococcota bacterium]